MRPGPIRFFGLALHPWTTEETIAEIRSRIESGRFTQHAVLNVAKVVYAQKDEELRQALEGCDIVNADGAGIVLGARILGIAIPERVAGIDLFQALVAEAEFRKWPIFLLGARQEVLDRTVEVLRGRHPALVVVGAHHGYFWDDERQLVEEIRESGAKLLFVAISTPRKERFIDRWKEDLGVSFAMGVGGSFDVLAGKVRRAPAWMQKAGLEWLFRVIQEPRRMWRRYLVTNLAFAFMLTRNRLLNR